MKTRLIDLPSYKINDYKIIMVPHQDLSSKVTEARKVFNEKFRPETPIKSRPELVLVTFKQLQANEDRILNRLRLIAMGQPQIKVEIKDFGSFPTHSIFLNVTSKIPLTNLLKKISSDAQRLMKLDADNKPHFFNDFYISIARKLKPWQYEQGWLEFGNINFTGRFIASQMFLMRRKKDEYGYKPVGNFVFQNMPVDTKQGELF